MSETDFIEEQKEIIRQNNARLRELDIDCNSLNAISEAIKNEILKLKKVSEGK